LVVLGFSKFSGNLLGAFAAIVARFTTVNAEVVDPPKLELLGGEF
jgi:hypothetical protein